MRYPTSVENKPTMAIDAPVPALLLLELPKLKDVGTPSALQIVTTLGILAAAVAKHWREGEGTLDGCDQFGWTFDRVVPPPPPRPVDYGCSCFLLQ